MRLILLFCLLCDFSLAAGNRNVCNVVGGSAATLTLDPRLESFTVADLKRVVEGSPSGSDAELLALAIAELKARDPSHADAYTAELMAKVFKRSPRAFEDNEKSVFVDKGDREKFQTTLTRFVAEALLEQRMAERDRLYQVAKQTAAEALRKMRSGELPPKDLDAAAQAEFFLSFSIKDIESLCSLIDGSSPKAARAEELLKGLWTQLGGKPETRPHKAFQRLIADFRRESEGLAAFRGKPAEDYLNLAILKVRMQDPQPPAIPGWEPPREPKYDVADMGRRVVTLMHENGIGLMPWLTHASDVNVKKTNPHPKGGGPDKDKDPWIKDHLPVAVQVGSGPNAHYVLWHYNGRDGNRGYFPEVQGAVKRPDGIPPEAKPFDLGGYILWAVPKGTEMKLEGGNFQKTKDFVLSTKLVLFQNKGRNEEGVRGEMAEASGVDKKNVILVDSVPGERTGHVDLVVRVLDYDKNVVAVPTIPAYMIKHLEGVDASRKDLAAKYNQYLDGIERQLTDRGLTVKRVPMFAPEPLTDDSGRVVDRNHPSQPSMSPFGTDVWFRSTANYSDGPNRTVNVPVDTVELARLSPSDQRQFHQDMTALFGDRYRPIPAEDALRKHGGAHCLTWTVNAAVGRVTEVKRY